MTYEQILSASGIDDQTTAGNKLLEKFGLNWTVEKRELFLPNGTPSGWQGITRSDNNTVFAACKDKYTPVQNYELLSLVNAAAGELGLTLTNGGSFSGGAQVYLQIADGKLTGIGKNGDTVKKYITAVNGHDRKLSLRWGSSSVVISCSNTFNAAKGQLDSNLRHTTNVSAQLGVIIAELEAIRDAQNDIYRSFEVMAEVKASATEVKQVAALLLGSKDWSPELKDKRNYEAVYEAIDSEMAQKGQTYWGLFNGATRYTTHQKSDLTARNKFFGQLYQTDNKVYRYLTEAI